MRKIPFFCAELKKKLPVIVIEKLSDIFCAEFFTDQRKERVDQGTLKLGPFTL